MKKMLGSFVAGPDEMSLRDLLADADSDYGSLALLRSFLRRIMSAIMIMTSHVLRCRPFARQSSFDVTTADKETEAYYDLEESNARSDDGDVDVDIHGNAVPTAPSSAPG